ncbi:hypothetical protein CSC15_0013 [Escherichia coli]|nr:hypothetical protein CSC15_0013 [Escherichia coli]
MTKEHAQGVFIRFIDFAVNCYYAHQPLTELFHRKKCSYLRLSERPRLT